MKEPYEKGLANRLGPASCAGDGNIAGVAGIGVHAGQVLTSEITTPACRPCPDMGKATRQLALSGESAGDAAESETLRMRETFQHGNREKSGDLLGRSTTLPPRSRPARLYRGAARSGRTRRVPNSRRERLRGVGRSRST